MANQKISDQTASSLTPFEPNPDKVLVAFNGDIASALCVRILQDQGFVVETIFFEQDNSSKEELAQKMALRLGVPFTKAVLQEKSEDIQINKSVFLLELLTKLANEQGFSYTASGHHARIEMIGDQFIVVNGAEEKPQDADKLKSLSQEVLAKLCLPNGEFSLQEMNDIAKSIGLL